MRGDTFRTYDPFARQRKKRTGSASDFGVLYQQDIDKPAIAKLVEATRRTERRRGERDEAVIEERAERIDAQARTDAANATYGDAPFAPRDFAAKQSIDLRLLGSTEFNSPTFLRAPAGSEERKYQDSNAAFGLPDYETVMAIPERRKTPRPAKPSSSFGQFQNIGADDQLRGGAGTDSLSANATKIPAIPEVQNKAPAKSMGALDSIDNRAQAARIYFNTELPSNGEDKRVNSSAQRTAFDSSEVGPYYNPNGKDHKKVPQHDLRGWDGAAWDDRFAFFTDGVKRKLSSRYGWRYLSEKRSKDFHGGIDVAAEVGSEVSSIDGGKVIWPKKGELDKKPRDTVVISKGGVLYTYLHIVPGKGVVKGADVEVGVPLGNIAPGSKPHLHYSKHKSANENLLDRIDANSIDPWQ